MAIGLIVCGVILIAPLLWHNKLLTQTHSELDALAETEEQPAMLKEAGFVEGQGYHFGRPLPSSEPRLADGSAVHRTA